MWHRVCEIPSTPAHPVGGAGDIVERLTRKVQVMPSQGGATLASDGSFTSYTTDDGKRLANPDGPEAADLIQSLQARLSISEENVERLREALKPFARIPMHGKHGGPFVIAHAVYEDMTKGSSAPREAYWHRDDFDRARASLGEAG
jgi:hypothetical protein